MNIFKLLLALMAFLSPGIVEDEGGGAAAVLDGDEDQDDTPGSAAEDEADGENAADGDDQGNDSQGDGAGEGKPADEVIVTIGDEQPASEEEEVARAPEWVRELRKQNREKDRRIRELEAKVNSGQGGTSQPLVLGAKPTLQGCDFDESKFENELEAWHSRKREIEDQAAKKQRIEDEQKQAWQAKVDGYNKAKGGLKVNDFEDAEAIAQETLNVTQQGVIINGAENPALLIYALGKNPKKAKELASITDPVKFAFAVAKLETKLKVTPRKAPPVPERQIRGNVPGSAAVDSQLERLRAEAEKTGDMSKVVQYKRQLRNKQG